MLALSQVQNLKTAAILAELGANTACVSAALFHGALERRAMSEAQVRETLQPDVAALVISSARLADLCKVMAAAPSCTCPATHPVTCTHLLAACTVTCMHLLAAYPVSCKRLFLHTQSPAPACYTPGHLALSVSLPLSQQPLFVAIAAAPAPFACPCP